MAEIVCRSLATHSNCTVKKREKCNQNVISFYESLVPCHNPTTLKLFSSWTSNLLNNLNSASIPGFNPNHKNCICLVCVIVVLRLQLGIKPPFLCIQYIIIFFYCDRYITFFTYMFSHVWRSVFSLKELVPRHWNLDFLENELLNPSDRHCER